MPSPRLNYMHGKNLGALLDESGDVTALMPQAKRLITLRQILAEVLPSGLSQYCSVANWRRGRLVIFAENNSVAAKLRLLCPGLVSHYLKRGTEVTAIDIRVQPSSSSRLTQQKQAVMTPAAAQALLSFAGQLADCELKTAVAALARHSLIRE